MKSKVSERLIDSVWSPQHRWAKSVWTLEPNEWTNLSQADLYFTNIEEMLESFAYRKQNE